MDARFELRIRCVVTLLAVMLMWTCGSNHASAFGVRTPNFLVDAPSPQLAKQVADSAEKYRRDLAMYWIGRELPTWPQPCPIAVVAGNHPAQGVTVYNQNPVGDFRMEVIGTPERILDSVLPHEITHTVLATHFQRPLPRWADEGICTTVEHPAEKSKHETKLREFLNTRRGIAMNRLFLLTEYPKDILPMYAQGYSVCRFLVEQKGPRVFIEFLDDFMNDPTTGRSWTKNIRRHYGYESFNELQNVWVKWVAAGSGPVDAFVKNPMTSAPAKIDLVAATLPATSRGISPNISPAKRSAAGPGQAAAGPTRAGWYSRTRDGQAQAKATPPGPGTAIAQLGQRGATPIAGGPPGTAKPLNSTLPPSVRNPRSQYSSAHPQPEQRIARQRVPVKTSQPNVPHFDPDAVRKFR